MRDVYRDDIVQNKGRMLPSTRVFPSGNYCTIHPLKSCENERISCILFGSAHCVFGSKMTILPMFYSMSFSPRFVDLGKLI